VPPQRNILADAAVEYAQRGWRIIALHYLNQYDGVQGCSCKKRVDCGAAGKHPVFGKWREVATTDVDKLRAWWRRWPRANIGILMGGQACLICIDIDGDEGRESLKQLEEAYSPLPPTLMQSTGREGGGEHRIFHVDPLYSDWIKNRARLAPGIDIRSEGGLIVGAPSLHSSGARYQWRNELPIAELPEWAFKFAISAREKQKEFSTSGERPKEEDLPPLENRLRLARRALEQAEPAIQGQNGSTACLRAAILIIRGYVIPTNDAFDLLWSVYNPVCQPAWADWELMHKIEDAELRVNIPWGYRLLVAGRANLSFDTSPDANIALQMPKPEPTIGDRIQVLNLPVPVTDAIVATELRRLAPKVPSKAEMLWKPRPYASPTESQTVALPEPNDQDDEDEEELQCA
jgi:putative DNA primase/helicase